MFRTDKLSFFRGFNEESESLYNSNIQMTSSSWKFDTKVMYKKLNRPIMRDDKYKVLFKHSVYNENRLAQIMLTVQYFIALEPLQCWKLSKALLMSRRTAVNLIFAHSAKVRSVVKVNVVPVELCCLFPLCFEVKGSIETRQVITWL